MYLHRASMLQQEAAKVHACAGQYDVCVECGSNARKNFQLSPAAVECLFLLVWMTHIAHT